MELLYFISGILSVGVLYGIWLLRTVKSSHADLLAQYQSHSNISSIRYEELVDEVKYCKDLMVTIQDSMEKDQYSSVAEINKKIEAIAQLANAINVREAQAAKLTETNFSKTFSEIQQLKKNIKLLGQDNFIK